MRRVALVLTLALATPACRDRLENERPYSSSQDGGTDDARGDAAPSVVRPICDGSKEIRFAVRIMGGGTQRPPSMMTNLGIAYLYIRGDCRYWVNPGVYFQWDETRAGDLTPAQDNELSATFNYASWGELAGYHEGNAGGPPAGLLQAFDGEHLINCDNSCVSYGVSLGTTLDRFSDAFRSWSMRLWTDANPSELSLRAVAERMALMKPLTASDLELVLPWPFQWPIDDLVADHASAGRLLTDEARVRDLRMLRSTYVSKGPLPDGGPNPFLRVDHFGFYVGDDRQTMYELWFRDALPFEQPDGTVSLPKNAPDER